MKKRRDDVDCVAVKERAQRALAQALAGKAPAEQVAVLQHLAAETPLWRSIAKTRRQRPRRPAQVRAKRRSTG